MAKSAKDRDRALAMEKANEMGAPEQDAEMEGDANMEEAADETPTEAVGSKVIVMHFGSQNLRIGLASDALPKTLPMVIARKASTSESEDHEEPKPKRLKRDDGSAMEPEKMFGPEVSAVTFHGAWLYANWVCSSHLSTPPCVQILRCICDRTSAGHFRTQRKWS